MQADLGTVDPGLEIVAESWVGFWVISLGLGALAAIAIWLIGGWWYRIRLNWSGDRDADPREARLVYVYAGLVAALPNVLLVTVVTAIYADYASYWNGEDIWSMLIAGFPFWAIYVSYCGAVSRFSVRRVKALAWFRWLPMALYVLALVAIVAMYVAVE
ncbi:MAG: hypothetical protein AAGD11_17565 [Planctomycetota bacterium]